MKNLKILVIHRKAKENRNKKYKMRNGINSQKNPDRLTYNNGHIICTNM